jgi:hypothetical protein
MGNTRVFAQVEVEGAGAICSVELRTPGKDFEPFIAAPPPGTIVESATIRVSMSYAAGAAMPAPMTLVIRTSRGVRFVDLGKPPPPRTDESGRLLDVIDHYIPDCLRVIPQERGRWGVGWHWSRDQFKPPPLEHPDWATYLREAGGLIVQLVQLDGLDSGELVRFRSATHAIDAVADAQLCRPTSCHRGIG